MRSARSAQTFTKKGAVAMRILVAHASRYGATAGIAERIAQRLVAAGHEAHVRPVGALRRADGYDAFVVGSALYFGRWLKSAKRFVEQNRLVLASRPTWLFSSGPLGTRLTDAEGRDLRVAAEPDGLPELRKALQPREHRVFFGALDPSRLGLRDRFIRSLPAARAVLPEGDFRDWAEIEAWADGIARALGPAEAKPRPREQATEAPRT